VHFDSYGHDVHTVDQRLTYAWVEGLRLMREAGGAGADLPYDKWGAKILAACRHLIEHRMEKLVGVRRFISRVLGTSTNHVALYVTTVYRAGQVLNQPELCDYALAIGRALAADIHPDGYWEEHGDLLRTGGPTLSYNYLTHCGTALMYEWTGEGVFLDAIKKSTAFHGNFCYPDATFVELLDERVRADHVSHPRVWGLFGFSHTPEGRGSAKVHFENWLKLQDKSTLSPELLGRHCENALYWHDGPMAEAPFQRRERAAKMTMPGGIFSKDGWCVSLSAMEAINHEDPAYRDNPFGLDRQKLFSVWHEKTGLLLDGSQAKNQPENSTFRAPAAYATDFYPAGGTVDGDGDVWIAKAAYKSFFGEVRVRPVSASELEITLKVDPAGNRGPFTTGFTMKRLAENIVGLNGRELPITEASEWAATAETLGGGFVYGPLTVRLPAGARVWWPFRPFNSYAADGKSKTLVWQVRVDAELTMEQLEARFTLRV
jgi:hypothetical protein